MKSLIKGKFRKLLNQFGKKYEGVSFKLMDINCSVRVLNIKAYNLDDSPFTHQILLDIEVLVPKDTIWGDQLFIHKIRKWLPITYRIKFNNLFKWFFPPSSSHILYKIDKITIKRI